MSGLHDPAAAFRYASLLGVRVAAIGGFVPELVVTNAELAARYGFDADWILTRTGIRERRLAPPDMATSDLAVRAAEQCLERAAVAAEDIELLIVGTFTSDMSIPSTACLVQHRLGVRAGALDVGAACSGFMYALVTGMQFVKTGNCKSVLVVGADCNSRVINPADIRTYPLFGDGAGAVLLVPGAGEQGLASYCLGSDGGGGELLKRPAGGSRRPLTAEALAAGEHYMHMDGRAVFKWAVRIVEDSVRGVLDHARVSIDDVKWFVLHQANLRILHAAAANLGMAPEKLVVQLDRYGNTSGGSIPLAWEELFVQGKLSRGDLVLLCGFGAGLTWGTGLYRW